MERFGAEGLRSMKDFFERQPKKPTSGQLGSKKRESRKRIENEREKSIAEKLGGYARPASGAILGHKGDFALERFLGDSKNTSGSSILVKKKDLIKIDREALGEGKYPVLVISFETMAEGVSREWACIPIGIFGELIK